PPAPRREILQAAQPRTGLLEPLLHGLASPAEAPFRLAGAAVTQCGRHLGQEQPASVAGQPAGSGTDQGVITRGGVAHAGPLHAARSRSLCSPNSRMIDPSLPPRSWVDLQMPVALVLLR